MRVASQLSIGTACPKAAKQWHAVSSSRINGDQRGQDSLIHAKKHVTTKQRLLTPLISPSDIVDIFDDGSLAIRNGGVWRIFGVDGIPLN